MIYIIATLTAREGRHDELVAAFDKNLDHVRAKRGCVTYDLAVHHDSGMPGQPPFDANDLLIVEAWQDWSAFTAHIGDPVYRAWYAGVYPAVAKASMQVLRQIGR
ncbi:MAG TPA: antibiotic biosynthesis monooxygenase family protein [Candidatus Baltobacteraceae bacterium]